MRLDATFRTVLVPGLVLTPCRIFCLLLWDSGFSPVYLVLGSMADTQDLVEGCGL